ncbi:MAG: hypothetical protein ACRC68_18255 [Clostridium sp.]
MSIFVLNRNYELQLPTSFVDVDREEMEYVDGGGLVSLTVTKASLGFLSGMLSSTSKMTSALIYLIDNRLRSMPGVLPIGRIEQISRTLGFSFTPDVKNYLTYNRVTGNVTFTKEINGYSGRYYA